MGPIHPRIKKPVGERLATAAMGKMRSCFVYTCRRLIDLSRIAGVVYGGEGAYAGPTLAGCTATADAITIRFNTTLL